MQRIFPILKKIALIAGIALFLLSFGVFSAYEWLQSVSGKEQLARWIEDASRNGDQALSIGTLEGSVPSALTLTDIQVSDSRGPWLKIDRLDYRWNPWSLFQGKFWVEELTVQTLGVLRKPVVPEAETTTSRREKNKPFPGIPVRVRVDRLEAEKIRVGKDVLGEEIQLALNSRMDYSGLSEGLSLNLNLQRVDQTPGTMDLAISFLPLTKTFVMGLNAREPAGGILVRALQVPDLPEMSATILGDGPLDDWKGRFELHAGPSLDVEGEAGLQAIARERYALNVSMTANLASFIPAGLQETLKEPVKVNTRVVMESFQRIRIETLNISHPVVQLDVEGDMGFVDGKMGLRYTFIAGEDKAFSSIVPGIHWKSLKLTGTAEGFLLKPNIDLNLEANSLASMDYLIPMTRARFKITPDKPLDQKGLILTVLGNGLINETRGPDPSLNKILPEKLTWRFRGSLDLDHRKIDAKQFEILSDVAVLKLNGQVNRWGEQARIEGTASLPEISKFSELAKTKVGGNLNLDVEIESEQFGKTVFTTFTTVIDKLDTGFSEVKTLVGDHVQLGGKASLGKNGVVHVDALEFSGEAVSGSLNATLTPNQMVDADLSVTLPRLAVLSKMAGKDLSGQLHVKGAIKGLMPSPTVHAIVESRNLIVEDFPVATGRVDLTVENLQEFPAGTLAAHAIANEWEVSTSTDFALQPDDRLSLEKIRICGLGAEIAGGLKVNLKSLSANGMLNGNIFDYSPVNVLIQKDVSGDTRFKMDLSDKNEQTVLFSTTVDNFHLRGDSPVAIQNMAVSGKVTHALKEPVIQSQLRLSGVQHPAATVEKAVLTMQGPVKALDFKLDTEATPTGGPEANVKISGRLNIEDQKLHLKTLAGKMGEIPFQMLQPALFKANGPELELTGLSLKIQEGQVSTHFKKNSSGIFGALTVDHFPLDMVNQVLPGFGVRGVLQGKAVLDGNLDSPKGQINFSVTQLTMESATKNGLTPATVDLQGNWEAGLANIDFKLAQTSVGEFQMNGGIPLVMAQNPVGINIPENAPLKATAKGQLGLEILNEFLVASGSQVQGKVDLAMRVGGVVKEPQVQGTVQLKDGSYENLKTGTTLTAMGLLASFDRNQLQVDSLSARTPKDGIISARGTVKKSGEDDFIADLKLNTKSAQLVATDTLTTEVTSNLHLLGPVKSAVLKGDVIIDRTEIYVPNNLPPSVVVLEVEESDGEEFDEKIKIESGKKVESEFDMGLDVKIKAPNQVFVRGRGLDAELEGDLLVTGSMQKPKVDGAFKLRRGTLDLMNRKVKFKQGVVGFDGVPEQDPDLDFKAEVPAKNMTILVSVLGAVSNPKIQLSSDPEMPQDEILANFLFDKSARSITPIEAVQLANSATQLAGMGGQGPGIMDKVRGSLGLDTLKFSGEDSGPGVEVGRYVAEGVYIGVRQGLGEDSSGAVLEYEVTPNITVESDIGANANSRVGVSMEWDY